MVVDALEELLVRETDPLRQPPGIDPGIYFGLDESDYHADPALSASGIKRLLVSPESFWAGSVFNPEYEDKKTDAMAYGTALHKMLLEGRDAFNEVYAVLPDKDEIEDILDGGAALKKRCAELDVSKSGTVMEMAERIAEASPEDRTRLWPLVMVDWQSVNDGLTEIRPEWHAKILRAKSMLDANPHNATWVTGGIPEVSIFWIDKPTGVRMKSRIDYLKMNTIVDLKSFANKTKRPVDDAVYNAIANERYHTSAVVYLDGVAQAKRLFSEQGAAVMHDAPAGVDWNKWAAAPAAFVFMFVESTGYPAIGAYQFDKGAASDKNLYWISGETDYRHAVNLFARFMKTMGPDVPWVEKRDLRRLHDEHFPIWMDRSTHRGEISDDI